jgi:hypothetical protein
MGLKTDHLFTDKEIDKLRSIYEKIPGLSNNVDNILPAKSISIGTSEFFDNKGNRVNKNEIIKDNKYFDTERYFVEQTKEGVRVFSNYMGTKSYVSQSLVDNMVFTKENGQIKVIGLKTNTNSDMQVPKLGLLPQDLNPKWQK